MRIAADGTWFYQKTPIGRPALVKLFASVLKREGDKYFLVTPVEKVGLMVEEAPFLAVELKVEHDARGQVLGFRTNVDDWVEAGPGHGLRFEPEPARRAQTVPACPPRPVGQGDAHVVLRSGRTRRRAHRCRQARCSASSRAENFLPWRKPARCGSSPDGCRGDTLGRRILRPRAGAAKSRRAARPERCQHHAQRAATTMPIR